MQSSDKELVDRAFNEKLINIRKDNNFKHPESDFLFETVRSKIFGKFQLKYVFVSSAPVDPEILDFFRIVLSCPTVEGYGMTEGHGVFFISSPNDPISGHVGGPIISIEMKIIDAPELNYYTTYKNEKGKSEPRGEICLRGNYLFDGYFLMKQETEEAIDKDGWLHSGDIGIMLNNEVLKIIDRRKNIFKLSQGEYIAPEKVENVIKLSKYAIQSYAYGISTKNYFVCLIVVEKDTILKLAEELGVSENRNAESLLKNGKFKK